MNLPGKMLNNLHTYPILDLDSLEKRGIEPGQLLEMWQTLGLGYYQLRAKRLDRERYMALARRLKSDWPEMLIIANDFLDEALEHRDVFHGVHLGQEDLAALTKEQKKRLSDLAPTGRLSRIAPTGRLGDLAPTGRLGRSEPTGHSSDHAPTDKPGFIIGISTHNPGQVREALRYYRGEGGIPWSYLAVGPILPTASKPKGRDPVIPRAEREEIFSAIAGIVSKGAEEAPATVLIGGLDAAGLGAIIPEGFKARFGFIPIIAVISAAMDKASLESLLAASRC